MSGREHRGGPFSDGAASGEGSGPVLRSRAGFAGAVPQAEHAGEATDRAAAFAHELNSLLDGSLRWLSLARSTLAMVKGQPVDTALEQLQRQLASATGGLEKMADLVHASMQGVNLPLGSALLANCPPVSLGEAIRHATEVLGPEASSLGVVINVEIPEELLQIGAGALYTVVLNGLKNSLEAIREAQQVAGSGAMGGRIDILVREEPAPNSGPGDESAWAAIIISDDGVGPPRGGDASRVFEHGFTTKEGGHGIGLALSREIVRGMGGTIQLSARIGSDRRRPGAMLRVAFPAR